MYGFDGDGSAAPTRRMKRLVRDNPAEILDDQEVWDQGHLPGTMSVARYARNNLSRPGNRACERGVTIRFGVRFETGYALLEDALLTKGLHASLRVTTGYSGSRIAALGKKAPGW
jgi:hypothetical protein